MKEETGLWWRRNQQLDTQTCFLVTQFDVVDNTVGIIALMSIIECDFSSMF